MVSKEASFCIIASRSDAVSCSNNCRYQQAHFWEHRNLQRRAGMGPKPKSLIVCSVALQQFPKTYQGERSGARLGYTRPSQSNGMIKDILYLSSYAIEVFFVVCYSPSLPVFQGRCFTAVSAGFGSLEQSGGPLLGPDTKDLHTASLLQTLRKLP